MWQFLKKVSKIFYQTKVQGFYSTFFIILIIITLGMEFIYPEYADYTWKGIGISIIFMLFGLFFPIINDLFYSLSWKRVDLQEYPSSTNDSNMLLTDLKTLRDLEKSNKYIRVMTMNERMSYSFIAIMVFFSLLVAFLNFTNSNYGDLVDWLSITALGLGVYPLIGGAAKNRIVNKINEVQSLTDQLNNKESDIQISQLKNQVNHLQSLTEKLLAQLEKVDRKIK
ncbi:hypothetical protein CEQ21_07415 (plasmid) [Niallia circulans]|uniref:Uncharacterized protein n=1 Tax=Niallia circulans TaxID=1397 RepID=A0A553SQW3_NIACI|nr:hypothetical protein [Niallia circulans]TRZ39382.1 hypothetical protein CEQ21_07415 [Niallia circulans]